MFTIMGVHEMTRAFGASETVLSGPDLVSVDDTADGQALATLLGKDLYGSLTRLQLVPASAGVYFASGPASAGSAPLPAGGIDLPIRKSEADALRFYAAAPVAMSVVQTG